MNELQRVWYITSDEWRYIRRNKVAIFAIVLLILLTLTAVISGAEYQRVVNDERVQYQSLANHAFDAQPDRHPHRVAHFGHFLFRPLDPLAAFETGVDPYTGHTIFLEAHRQNSANFSDVRQSSLLVRFGQLTPAFILQILVPLLLIFVGHAIVSREKQSGTLRLLLSQGVRVRTFILGKFLALTGVALISFLPASMALVWIGWSQSLSAPLIGMLALAYLIWLLIWVTVVMLASTLLLNGRDALLSLLTIWCVCVIIMPRIAPDIISKRIPLTSNIEINIAVERDFLQLGDSHNPDDPYFSDFKQKILDQYKVGRVEDLPVNFKGLLMAEGERLSSELFNRYLAQNIEKQQLQNHYLDQFSWASPILALRRLSMVATASDLRAFHHFLTQAEDYRYQLMQHLNELQTTEINYQYDNDGSRIDHQHWQQFKSFEYTPFNSSDRIHNMRTPFCVLSIWFLLLFIILIVPANRYMGRQIR
ncbi:ABC transporter permease [Acinetobacter sp. ESBL14]|uniref:ABC transporter permease n=1 Tax=Acinetobacter sp. ESBL14 TaxID=3077329 RepID=UPI002FC7D020